MNCYCCKKCKDAGQRVLSGHIISALEEYGYEAPLGIELTISDVLLAVKRALSAADEELDSLKCRLDYYENPDSINNRIP